MPTFNCAPVVSALKYSKQFPSVFAEDTPRLFTDLCFVSTPEGIRASIDEREVIIHSASAWTTDYNPSLFGGPDNTGSVITQWTVIDADTEFPLGKVFTMDTINLIDSTELDTIVGGTGWFLGLKGAIRINSTLEPSTGRVNISSIAGTVCQF